MTEADKPTPAATADLSETQSAEPRCATTQAGTCAFWRGVLVVLVLCGLADLGLFCWGINRGFDVKDEAFMVMCYRFPQLYAALTTSFHILVTRFTGGFGWGILAYRWLGFGLKLLAMLVFAWGFRQWLVSRAELDKQS